MQNFSGDFSPMYFKFGKLNPYPNQYGFCVCPYGLTLHSEAIPLVLARFTVCSTQHCTHNSITRTTLYCAMPLNAQEFC